MRIFISIDIPEEVKKEIKKIQDKLPEFIGKKTELENLHLTLKFLGEINKEKIIEVKKRLNEIKFDEFEVEINNVGVFDENFIRIIWLHLTNCEVLQKKIDGVLGGLFEKEKRFMGHLTIARIKKVDKKKFLQELKKIKVDRIKFSINDFKLKQSVLNSQGPVYKNLANFVYKKEI